MIEPTTYLNTKNKCIVCFKKPKDNFPLVKHHVKYFPEVIAFVHYDCHAKIHDINNPISHLIQYEPIDSRNFYEGKQKKEPKYCSECGGQEPKHYRLCKFFVGDGK